MEKAVKYFLFFFILWLLWIPLVLKYVPFIKEKNLHGDFTAPAREYLSAFTWLDGEFQKKYNDWFNFSMGLHTTGVRLSNQLNHWMGEQPVNEIIGKENDLMDMDYINAYFGKDFVGEDSIARECRRIQRLQTLLKEKNKDFFIVIAPNKSRIYAERIPDFCRPRIKNESNYECYVKEFRNYNIHHIDVNQWFEQAKDTSRYPLFTKRGVHWSMYGGALFADSLLKYMEHLSSRKIGRLKITNVVESDSARSSDDDIYKILNLLCEKRPAEKYAYAETETLIDASGKQPEVLTVGDSYYYTLSTLGVPQKFFADSSCFFHYNTTAYYNDQVPHPVNQLNLPRVVLSKDVIMLIYTEFNLKGTGFQFIDNALAGIEEK